MITVDFENRTEGLCKSLCSKIRTMILSGELKKGEKLPSKRALSEHLGVSIITVQNAYQNLISEGFVYSIERSGFFVSDSIPFYSKTPSKNQVEKAVHRFEKETDLFADFSSSSANAQKFPFSLWARLMRKVLSTNDEKLLRRTNAKGIAPLRAAIAHYLFDFRNLCVSSEQIVIGAGSESLISMLVSLLGREKLYVVENPGYKKIARLFEANGASVKPVAIDDAGLCVEKLYDSNALVAHVSPEHHFPTGIKMPLRRRRELLTWANEHHGFIIEDEFDSEFRFSGKPLPTLKAEDTEGRVIYINTFSKTISPAFRVGYMVLPPELLLEFERKLGFYSCQVPSFEQFTLFEFIAGGHFARHISRMKNRYRSVRNALVRAILESDLKDIAKIREKESGLHFLLSLPKKCDCREIRRRLFENAHIQIPLLSDFFFDDGTFLEKDDFVMNYSSIFPERIPEIVRRISAEVKNHV